MLFKVPIVFYKRANSFANIIFIYNKQLQSLTQLTSPLPDECLHLITINITVLIHKECSPETT